MKYLIASDFHGNNDAYKELKRAAENILPDKIILLGDYFDGSGVAPVNNELKKIFFPLLAVQGNCDYPALYNALDAGLMNNGFFEEINGRRVYFTHGHIYGRNSAPAVIGENDAVFYGHYHVPEISKSGGIWRVCVGSAGRPRGGSDACFCVFDGIFAEIFSFPSGKSIVKTKL